MIVGAELLKQDLEELQNHLLESDLKEAVEVSRRLSRRRVAEVLQNHSLQNIIAFLKELGWKKSAKIIEELPEELGIEILEQLESSEKEKLVMYIDSHELVDLLNHLEIEIEEEYWQLIDQERKAEIKELSSYSEEQVGAHMETWIEDRFLIIEAEQKVEEASKIIRQAQGPIENTAYIYVVDRQNKLLGIVSVQEIIFAQQGTKVETIMNRKIHVAEVNESALEAARVMRNRNLKVIPVVDGQQRLVGIMNLDTAIDLLSGEIADDFVAIGGASVEESFFTRPRDSIRLRLPWMAANIFLNLGAVAVISSFEETIAQIAILAAFLPMITDMGGNVGIQALSVSIRSIALGEVQLGDFGRALRKEAMVGVINGLALGTIFAMVAYFLQGSPLLGILAGVALATNVLVAGIVGGTMPFIIKKLGKDPALMTGPVLTTVTDITGVSIYLGLSTLFMSNLLG